MDDIGARRRHEWRGNDHRRDANRPSRAEAAAASVRTRFGSRLATGHAASAVDTAHDSFRHSSPLRTATGRRGGRHSERPGAAHASATSRDWRDRESSNRVGARGFGCVYSGRGVRLASREIHGKLRCAAYLFPARPGPRPGSADKPLPRCCDRLTAGIQRNGGSLNARSLRLCSFSPSRRSSSQASIPIRICSLIARS